MKILPIYFLLLLSVFAFSCGGNDDDNATSSDGLGRVFFGAFPFVENDTLNFAVHIQFATPGGPIDIEYQIWEGNNLLDSGVANADTMIDGLGLVFGADTFRWPLAGRNLSGKTVLIWLDPEHKVTLESFQTEAFVDLYKKEEIQIP